MKRKLIAVMIALGVGAIVPVAHAANIIDEWASVKAPPPPALNSVTVDAKTTALLMLDFLPSYYCSDDPRCVASLPAMKKLLAEARAHGATVIYSFIAHTTAKDVLDAVAPQAGEQHVTSGPDKFLNTDLAQMLKDKGIKTVIAVGTSADGAVLYTASGAALRGMNVIVPVDGMSSASRYADLVTTWPFTDVPLVSKKLTLSKLDMVSFIRS
jgi:nicotinamidase-related amidase